MADKLLCNDYIDNHFKELAQDYLSRLEAKYTPDDLKKIHIEKLRVLIDTVEDFKPKSQIRQGKRGILIYLNHFIEHPINQHSYKELLVLKNKYIFSLIGNNLERQGFMLKSSLLMVFIFTAPVDIFLWIVGTSKYYFFIPIVSILFILMRIKDQLKAKRENKLW